MSLRDTHKTNQTAEIEGVWVPVGMHNGKPQEIKLSRMSRSNKRYTKELEKVTRPYSAAIQNETMDNDQAALMLQQVFADTILLDWKNIPKYELTGIEADKEVAFPFSSENAMALFAEVPDLYDAWEAIAKKSAAFREAQKEISGKN